jgi:hypothetical protein
MAGSAKTPPHILERFAEHATEIGHLVFAWARLQQNLGQLFAAIVCRSTPEMGLAIWSALKSDRSQREVLEAATEVALIDLPKLRDEIFWLLREIDNRVVDRNDAVHTAFLFASQEDGEIAPVPDIMSNPGRLVRLGGKDLIEKFEASRDDAFALYRYTAALTDQLSLSESERPAWPERPQLQSGAQSQSRKGQRRQIAAKRSQPPP